MKGKSMWTLSIDIGGTYIKSALIMDTQIREKRQIETPKTDKDNFILVLVELIYSYQQIEPIEFVGFSVPGAVKEASTVFFGGAVACLNEVNLKQEIEKHLPVRVFVENDAKAAVLGEASFGHLKGIENGAGIILGTGVGVGLLLDGQVRKGPHCQAGEVSFLIQDRGINGAESFAAINLSAVRLVKELAKLFQCEPEGPLVFDYLYQKEDDQAQTLYRTYCNQVAILCFNIQCLLDLDKIIIGGGISKQKRLIRDIQKNYEAIFSVSPMIEQTITKMTIEAAAFESEANLIGAAKGVRLNEISN
ncbi:TPA: ROK family protein [Enterococcus faecium]